MTKLGLFLALALALASCANPWGPMKNPVDDLSPQYEGVPTVAVAEFKLLAPLVTTSNITLQATKVAGAEKYGFEVATDEAFTSLETNVTQATSTLAIDLADSDGGERWYRSRVKVSGGWSEWTPAQAVTLPPQAPTGLVLTPGDGQLTLNWAGSTGATKYDLYWSIHPQVTTANTKVAQVTSPCTLDGLPNGHTYYVALVARNAGGSSALSGEVNGTPAPDTTPPANPASLTVTAGNAQVSLSWSNPTDADFAGVQITWTPTGGSPAQPLTLAKTNTSTTITGLTNGTSYTFTVKSVDTVGNRSAGSTVTGVPAFSVGDVGPAGGIIFYDKGFLSGGWRYLEAAPSDASSGIQWLNGSYINITTSTDIGSGKANTNAIIAAQGSGDYAARLCRYLSYGGFTDWFLPSKDELNLLYTVLAGNGLGGFAHNFYWSSSQDYYGGAWSQDFDSGDQYDSSKSTTKYVRAVRAF